MDKRLLVACTKNLHRIVLVGTFQLLSVTFLWLGDVCQKIENWLSEKLPSFGEYKE